MVWVGRTAEAESVWPSGTRGGAKGPQAAPRAAPQPGPGAAAAAAVREARAAHGARERPLLLRRRRRQPDPGRRTPPAGVPGVAWKLDIWLWPWGIQQWSLPH